MSCKKALNGKDSILYSTLSEIMSGAELENKYAYIFSKEFSDKLGFDWQRYSALKTKSRNASEEEEYAKIIALSPEVYLDVNGEPNLSEFLRLSDINPQDAALRLIEMKSKSYQANGINAKGVSTFISDFIAGNLDKSLYRFNAEEYIRNETRNRMSSRTGLPQEQFEREYEEIKSELTKKVESWENLRRLGERLHDFNRAVLSMDSITSYEAFEEDFPAEEIPPMPDFLLKEYVTKLIFFGNELRSRGKILTEMPVMHDGKNPLRGVQDIILVLPDGSAEIYDYKFSVKGYNNYNEQKQRTLEYQLSLYRNILENYGIRVNSINIVPILLEGDSSFEEEGLKNLSFERTIDLGATSRLSPGNFVYDLVNELVPVRFSKKSMKFESNQRVAELMQKLFNHDITQEDASITFEEFKSRFYVIYEDKEGKKKHYVLDRTKIFSDNSKKFLKSELLESSNVEALEKELRSMYHVYLSFADSEQQAMLQYIKNLKEAIEDGSSDPVYSSETSYGTVNMKHGLVEYANDDWEPIESDELKALGILAMVKRGRENIVDFVIKMDENYDTIHNLGMGANRSYITGSALRDSQVDQTADFLVPKSTKGNVAVMKAILWIMNNPDAMEGLKVGKIKLISEGMTARAINLSDFKKSLKLMGDAIPKEMMDNLSNISSASPEVAYAEYLTSLILNSGLPRSAVIKLEKERDALFQYFSDKNPEAKSQLVAYLKNELKDMLFMRRRKDSNYNEEKYKMLSETLVSLTEVPLGGLEDMLRIGYMMDANQMLSIPQEFKGKFVQAIVDLTTKAIYNTGFQFKKFVDEARPEFETFFESVGFGGITRNLIGDVDGLFTNIVELKDEEGRNILRVKPLNQLSEGERKIAEYVLETLLPYKMKGMPSDTDVDNYRNTEEYRDLPLLPSGFLTKFRNMPAQDAIKEAFKNYFQVDRFMSNEPRSSKDLKEEIFVGNSLRYYSSGTIRDKILNDQPAGSFEINLQTILYAFMMQEFKSEQFNRIMPEVDAIKTALLVASEKTGIPMDKTMEWIDSYLETAVFNKPEVNIESKGAERLEIAMQVASKVTTTGALGLSLGTGAIQMIQGILNNSVETISNIVGSSGPNMGHLAKASAIVFAKEASFESVNLMEGFNETYRVANMDLQYMASRMADRRGVMHFASRWLFWLNSAPDYFNRMTFFTAHMLKDGSYDAHTVVDEKLVYDYTKDERFAVYLSGDTSHADYQKQKALYEFTIQELSKEEGGVDMVEGKLVPLRAYTISQIRSMNYASDRIHGSYNHEDKIKFAKSAWGRLFTQFKVWLRSKVNRYFQDSTINPSAYGEIVYEQNAEGEMVAMWKGKMVEGILKTLSFVYYDLTDMSSDMSFIQKISTMGSRLSEDQKKNLMRFSADILIVASAFGLYELLEEEIKKDRDSYKAQVARILLYSASDFNIFASLGMLFDKGNPLVSIGYLRKLFEQTMRVVTLEDDPIKMLKVFGATRMLYDYTKE